MKFMKLSIFQKYYSFNQKYRISEWLEKQIQSNIKRPFKMRDVFPINLHRNVGMTRDQYIMTRGKIKKKEI